MGLFSRRGNMYVNETPDPAYDNALTRRFTGPAEPGEYLWRVTYRVKGDGKRGNERPQMIRVLAKNQEQAEEAVRAYMFMVYDKQVIVDSTYNAGQASYQDHFWYRSQARRTNG